MESARGLERWTSSDWDLADAAIKERCSRDIWNEIPSYSQYEQSLTVEDAITHWRRHLRDGQHDAAFALLLSLSLEVETLSIDSVVEFSVDKHPSKRNYDVQIYGRFDTRVGGDADYLAKLFRGATTSQNQAALQVEGKNMALLPKLHTLTLSSELTRAGEEHRMNTLDILPCLLLPSLRSSKDNQPLRR